MKHIISSGTSVVSDIIRSSGIVCPKGNLYSFIVSVDMDSAKKFDTFGDAMKVCTEINKLIGKPIFKVMTLND